MLVIAPLPRNSNIIKMEVTASQSDYPGYSWCLEKYARWDGTTWLQVDDDGGSLSLHLKNMQLLVINKDTALESLGLSAGPHQICGVWKGATLLITVKHQDSSRKFRVKFAACDLLSDELNCKECVQVLQRYVPVYSSQECDNQCSTVVPTCEWFRAILSGDQQKFKAAYLSPEPLPPEFPLEKTIELCLLDPSFPALVDKIQSHVQKYT